MTRRAQVRGVALVVVLALGSLGVAACTGSDDGGVITGTTPPTTVTSGTTVAPAATTTTALPGGTLPAS
jgi:hypothetical protein